MPELPEAEIVARQVRDRLLGARLHDLWIGRDDIVRQGLASRQWYLGSVLDAVERRGKSVVLQFGKNGAIRYLVAELGMTGLLLFASAETACAKHTHVRLQFEGGAERELRYWNPRRFGRMWLMDETGLTAYTARRFGLDPLTMNWETFWSMIRNRRGRIKSFLMHQQLVAGIGNIYANEILFRARVHPNRPVDRLSELRAREVYRQIQCVLSEAISYGGSSIRDFVAPDGMRGRYATRHLVYNHGRQACPGRCGGVISVSRGARTTFYCPRCQR